jgi:hypothetical protein
MTSGNQMAAIINPVNGYRGMLEANGKEVKNHMIENRKLIKEKEELKKREFEEASQIKSKLKGSLMI